ncbi:hypothetical protein JRQ81_004928 [Phrynocephalus forsythii]|uniref:Uncharacterized protein n=1 Tax=Phrynocephalus forsythii TaxID=171643 RepID=A0A9Q0XFT4_9SAUR|nr:hypothetical protein JRQ81_004928 [Phrynocephalus forsythii]
MGSCIRGDWLWHSLGIYGKMPFKVSIKLQDKLNEQRDKEFTSLPCIEAWLATCVVGSHSLNQEDDCHDMRTCTLHC